MPRDPEVYRQNEVRILRARCDALEAENGRLREALKVFGEAVGDVLTWRKEPKAPSGVVWGIEFGEDGESLRAALETARLVFTAPKEPTR